MTREFLLEALKSKIHPKDIQSFRLKQGPLDFLILDPIKLSSIFSDILDMVFDTLYFFDLSRGAIVDYRIHIEPFAFNVMFAFLLLGTVKICLMIKIIYDLDLTDDDLTSVAIKESMKSL